MSSILPGDVVAEPSVVPRDPLDCRVGVRFCMKVARSIGQDWKWLGRAMGIEDKLDSIEEKHKSKKGSVEEMVNEVLSLWKKDMGERATVRALYDILIEVGREDLAEEIMTIASESRTKANPTTTCGKTQPATEKDETSPPSLAAGSYTTNTFGSSCVVSGQVAGIDQIITYASPSSITK